MSTRNDITVNQGYFRAEDKAIVFTILQDDGTTPENITGWTLTFRVAATLGGAAIIVKTPVLTTPLAGVCTVTLASADTSALTADTFYYYDLRRTDSGSRAELSYGTMLVQETYTNG